MTMTNTTQIEIKARQSQLDPDLCTFLADRTVHNGGPHHFDDDEAAKGSPLPEELFATGGVDSVVIQNESVIVRKKPDADWSKLMPVIGQTIREQVATGAPVITEATGDDPSTPQSDAELKARIQLLLDEEINPALGHHGGSVTVEAVKDRVAYVRLQGGCQGCAGASMTLRHGVEVMLRRAIPSIAGVVDATDHTAGEQPYY